MIEFVLITAAVSLAFFVGKKVANRVPVGSVDADIQPNIENQPNQRDPSLPSKWQSMGHDFEKFMLTRFDNQEYRLIEWRSDKYAKGWGGPESSRAPDLLMEHIESGDRFAIECKFRSRVSGNRLVWARSDQLACYQQYELSQNVPVYIAIGLGGKPSAPDSLFIVKLERMKFPDVMLNYLEQFRFPASVHGLEFG